MNTKMALIDTAQRYVDVAGMALVGSHYTDSYAQEHYRKYVKEDDYKELFQRIEELEKDRRDNEALREQNLALLDECAELRKQLATVSDELERAALQPHPDEGDK